MHKDFTSNTINKDEQQQQQQMWQKWTLIQQKRISLREGKGLLPG